MRLQKNTMLALYAVLDFAGESGHPISAAEIADRYGVSAHHLAKVLAELVRAGMLDSVRGAGGGYRFTGNARRLALMDVIQLFEDIAPSAAAREGEAPQTPVELALGQVLDEIDQNARATFKSITLATMLRLVERQRSAAELQSTLPSP